MIVESVNVGLPRRVAHEGRTVSTGIYKEPVAGRVMVRATNLDGDRQADLRVHGGPDKAVYLYPAEHYPHWRETLAPAELAPGWFGENLTARGVLEDETWIGDVLRVGEALLEVSQPRVPCAKLAMKAGDPAFGGPFLRSGRSGFYLAVLREGEVARGNPIEFAARDDHGVTVADIASLYARDMDNADLLRRAVDVPALPESWKEYFRERLFEPDA